MNSFNHGREYRPNNNTTNKVLNNRPRTVPREVDSRIIHHQSPAPPATSARQRRNLPKGPTRTASGNNGMNQVAIWLQYRMFTKPQGIRSSRSKKLSCSAKR